MNSSKSKIQNKVVAKLVKVYVAWLEEQPSLGFGRAYQLGIDKTKHLVYASKDIANLCLRLKDYEQHKEFEWSGLFLSGLINKCKDEEFFLMTEHLDKQISLIGYENTKKIVVQGNTQDHTGGSMSGGSITVKGNAGQYTGSFMNGGVIKVTGTIQQISKHVFGGKIYEKDKLVRGKKDG